MKTDIPISKKYIAARAYQSYYKVAKNPRSKVAFIKNIVKKYNTTDLEAYKAAALQNFTRGNEKVV